MFSVSLSVVESFMNLSSTCKLSYLIHIFAYQKSILELENSKQTLITEHQQTIDELTQLKSQHSATEDDSTNGSCRNEERIKELEHKLEMTLDRFQKVENKIREVEESIKSKIL